MKRLHIILLTLACAWGNVSAARAAEVMPPAPAAYFNDYAHVVAPDIAGQLNTKLENFEKQTSNQVVVAVFPKMESDSSIEDYTVRVAQSWGVGQKVRKNGVVLFVFIADRKMYIQVGYGLEGALPDALCQQIIENEIKPHFKAGDYAAGLAAGVDAILAATKGEYQAASPAHTPSPGFFSSLGRTLTGLSCTILFIPFLVVIAIIRFLLRLGGINIGSDGSTSSSGWSSGSGGGSSGGGGFSGGGGSFGGGGAGGSW